MATTHEQLRGLLRDVEIAAAAGRLASSEQGMAQGIEDTLDEIARLRLAYRRWLAAGGAPRIVADNRASV